MHNSHFLAALALFAAALSAQQTFTSPIGFDTTEANSNHDYILFKYNKMRWQQMDHTPKGTGVKVLRSIAWRRDGTSTATARAQWTARTADIAILMANAQPIAATSTNFDANYRGTPTTTFTMKPVNLPDWTGLPATPPAAFDLKLTFDVPWLYTSQHNLLWEVRADNNTAVNTNYGNDHQTQTGTLSFGSNTGAVLGSGCIATGRAAGFALASTVYNYLESLRISATVGNGPASVPAVLFLDMANANLNFPGLCTTLFVLPTLSVPMGTTTATGDASLDLPDLPYNPAAVNMPLYFQAAALDAGLPGIPVALTNGRQNTVPATPNPPLTSRIYEYWITTSMRAPSSWTGALIAQFEY